MHVVRTDRNGMRCRVARLYSYLLKEEAAGNGLEVGKTAAIDTRQIKPLNWKQSQPNWCCHHVMEGKTPKMRGQEASVVMQRLSYPTETVLSNKVTRNRIVPTIEKIKF